ncbi:YoaP domain-containing protein [Methanosarcina horonobensis]|uniref:YoaP domain-containing protein n=1 Tax=Methanosarcina horonobensis TaxID=418008 RepID=UPI0022B8E6CE|nr:YoaP domain-containing protein [Methanosarcina horonobensis]
MLQETAHLWLKKDIFLKKGFILVDEARPDFELLVLKFNQEAPDPKFKNMSLDVEKYAEGLTIIRSVQCPYSVKNVDAILETARNKLKMKTSLIDIKDSDEAQHTPCAFGTFCIIYNGKVISHHPISNTRFENIMKKMIK